MNPILTALCSQTMDQRNLQQVRLFIDVIVLGPMLIWVSYQLPSKHPKWIREVLFWSGVGTIGLNAINYLCVQDQHTAYPIAPAPPQPLASLAAAPKEPPPSPASASASVKIGNPVGRRASVIDISGKGVPA